jgi:hypothetical protein
MEGSKFIWTHKNTDSLPCNVNDGDFAKRHTDTPNQPVSFVKIKKEKMAMFGVVVLTLRFFWVVGAVVGNNIFPITKFIVANDR